MANHWERLINLWRRTSVDQFRGNGVAIRSPTTPQEIQAFESKHDVVLPADMTEYFLTVDGMHDDFDSAMNRFWPLHMVRPVDEYLTELNQDRMAYPGCFVFADHSLDICAWTVQLGKTRTLVSGPVFEVSSNYIAGQQIAQSFTAFVDTYLKDQFSIL